MLSFDVITRGICRINFGKVQTLTTLGVRGVPQKLVTFDPFVNKIMAIFVNFLHFVNFFPIFS